LLIQDLTNSVAAILALAPAAANLADQAAAAREAG
jgi:hypothetical protein